MEAIRLGDYAGAYEALQQTTEAGTMVGASIGAFLLALLERFEDAHRLLGTAHPSFRSIVQGEQQRVARWRDPRARGNLVSPIETPLGPLYAAMGAAFAERDQAAADRAKADLMRHERPTAGRLTFVGGDVRAFEDIRDVDDAIGQMLETYCGDGLVYFPFSGLRRVERLPPTSFMDKLMLRAKLTAAQGTATVYVPLLYACSATAHDALERNGRMTFFDYLGKARRGRGQRDFQVGTAMVGLGRIAAIDFD